SRWASPHWRKVIEPRPVKLPTRLAALPSSFVGVIRAKEFDLSVVSPFRRLQFLLRPRWLVTVLVLSVGAAFGGVHAWAWYHLHAGQTALQRYQNEAARAHLKSCLKIWPRSVTAHLLAARAERRAGDWTGAEQHLDECRKWADAQFAEEVAFEWSLLR